MPAWSHPSTCWCGLGYRAGSSARVFCRRGRARRWRRTSPGRRLGFGHSPSSPPVRRPARRRTSCIRPRHGPILGSPSDPHGRLPRRSRRSASRGAMHRRFPQPASDKDPVPAAQPWHPVPAAHEVPSRRARAGREPAIQAASTQSQTAASAPRRSSRVSAGVAPRHLPPDAGGRNSHSLARAAGHSPTFGCPPRRLGRRDQRGDECRYRAANG